MSKGIVLFAFGKTAYYNMAYQMALSIKATSDLEVALVHDLQKGEQKPMPESNWEVFDKLIPHKKKHNDAGEIKCNMYEYLPFKDNLYLDVDGCVLKDITPLFDELIAKDQYFYTDIVGSGGKEAEIDYSIWADNETAWSFFELGDDAILPAIQSSYMYVQKGEQAKEFFEAVAKNFAKKFPVVKLLMKWGVSVPDELMFSGTMAQRGMNAEFDGGSHVFFGRKNTKTITEVFDEFYVLALYGSRNLVKLRYKEMYDRYMRNLCKGQGIPFSYKAHTLLRNKHANG